ncbi:MAG: hypothetical protein WAT39_15990 [Planctomycetota bacterium]
MNHLPLSLLSLPLSLAALLATPAAAQDLAVADQPAAAKRVVKLAIDGADFAVALVALADERIKLADGEVLANALVMVADQDGNGFCVTMLDADLDFYWQSLAVDATGLRLGAIQRVPARRPPITTDRTPVKDDQEPTQVKSDLPPQRPADTAAPPRSKDDGTVPALDLPLSIRAKTNEAGLICALHFAFVAPTDGYGLGLFAVKGARPEGNADIYLYRKFPGEGEGHQDMWEEHRLAVELPKVQSVRVFLAEGKTVRPGSDTTWRQIAKL